MKKIFAIIGAGHNGLVTACYLAKAGHIVWVFEKRSRVGGCASTNEDIFPGFKVSETSYVNSLFLPKIVEDLRLHDYGYEVLERNPSSFTPLPDGRYLMLSGNEEFNRKEISKFSERDADAFVQYEKDLDAIAKLVFGKLIETPPHFLPNNFEDFKKFVRLAVETAKLGPKKIKTACELFFGNPISFLNNRFETDVLKATLLPDALIGATEINGYVLLHHVMGLAGGSRGIWGYQRGGMGGISNALAKAATDMGVKIHTSQPVKNIVINRGKAVEVQLENDNRFLCDAVVSNADPFVTFCKLVGQKEILPAKFFRDVSRINFSSATTKINMTLNNLPRFDCIPDPSYGQHHGTIHFSPSIKYILKALQIYKVGMPSHEPIIEMTIPSTVDETVAPSGKHIAGLFVQFTPYRVKNIADYYFERNILGVIEQYAPNIRDVIEQVQILTPQDLEKEFSITGGNIFHGAMSLGRLFSLRPIPGFADYRTPIKNLYLCGAGTHPGGGVMGACGYNAAREILKDHSPV